MGKEKSESGNKLPAETTATSNPFREMEKRLVQLEKRLSDIIPESWLQPSK
jgi:hypothetical protein